MSNRAGYAEFHYLVVSDCLPTKTGIKVPGKVKRLSTHNSSTALAKARALIKEGHTGVLIRVAPLEV